jgi:hydroxyethylthiazole kinase-like uncharacterized protein yjeF
VPSLLKPTEVVGTAIPATDWADAVLEDLPRFGALAIGNGLGLDPAHTASVRRVVAEAGIPVVVDADALTLLGEAAAEVTGPRTIVTPHDGEFERLSGARPGPDRIGACRELAARFGGVVLLKGRTTVVAGPDGRALVTRLGDERLATLGSGDVLAGIIVALCGQGLEPLEAAALGAALHGWTARIGLRHGLTARDLVDQLPLALESLMET